MQEVRSILRPKKKHIIIYMKNCVSIKISLLLYNVFCYISYEIIFFLYLLWDYFFFYISYEIIIFSSLQLTPGDVFINNCEWRHQCHFSELHWTPPSQILDPPLHHDPFTKKYSSVLLPNVAETVKDVRGFLGFTLGLKKSCLFPVTLP